MDRSGKFSIIFLSSLWITIISAGDGCTTTECIHASAKILERIDSSVDPCENFYDFACGTFIQDTYPPDESVAVDSFTKLRETIDAQIYALLNDANSDDHMTTTYKLSKELFQTCLDKNRQSEDDDVRALKSIIEELGGWPLVKGAAWDGTGWSFGKAITNLRKTFAKRGDKIFDIASFIITLEHANNPSIRPSATVFSLRNAYSNYISNLVTFLGGSKEAAERESELNQLLDFEYKLNSINHKLQQLSHQNVSPQKSEEFLKKILQLKWLDFFHPSQMKNIQVTEIDGESDKEEKLLEEMGELFENASDRTLANLIIFRVIDFVASQSTAALSDIYVQFQRQIDGRLDREQKWKECVDVLTKNLPFAVGSMFVGKYFRNDTKASIMEMFENIKQEYIELFTHQAEALDESTREKSLNKLKSLVPLIAYPNDGFDEQAINEFYDDIKIDKNQYLRTLFQLRVIDADNKFRQTFTSTALESSNNWKKYLPPTSIAAFYSTSDNTIRFSAGILQNVVYEGHKINYLEYGATGFIIAHEISHIVNQIIDNADTLPEKVKSEFAAKKRCVIEQYDEYKEPELSLNLDGKRTLNENIADIAGLKMAYNAYRKWNENFTGKRLNLIGLDHTWDQLFFISSAQMWCGVYREEELRRKVSTDSYATERFRVIGALSNSPDFVSIFNCSQSSSMNRKNKCIIW